MSTLRKFYRHGVPSYILSFGESLGDNLLLGTLAKELYERGCKNIWIRCDYPILFENNPYVKLVLPYHTLLSGSALNAFRVKRVSPRYTVYNPETDQDEIPDKHIILKMADALQLRGRINNKPIFNLNEREKAEGQLANQQIVITTSGTGALFPMKNKEWSVEKYQQVVNRFRIDFTFIQLGSANDEALEHVVDLRGKTDVRKSAAILSNSLLMISHVGFMMHLARAVDCRSVIVYGGREKPVQSGYSCFENIYSDVKCSPCWLHNKCDYNKICMEMISAKLVENAIRNQLQMAGKPLDIETLYND
jgi:hypothetical protein